MRVRFILLVLTMLTLVACREDDGHEDMFDAFEHVGEAGEPAGSPQQPNFPTILVDSDAVEPFHTTVRTDSLVRYPCTSCHTAPLEEMSSLPPAHLDITLEHAGPETMSCVTCHDTDNLDQLHTLTERPVEFDRSYETCAQCHSSQFDDWEGGGHGKRLEGWTPPRVVENCVGCHNPHAPGFEMRWPAVTGGGTNE